MKQTHYSPFNLNNTEAYHQWRENKLSYAKTKQHKRIIRLKKTPPHFYSVSPWSTDKHLSVASLSRSSFDFPNFTQSILKECNVDNYCLYKLEDHDRFSPDETKRLIHKLATGLGLNRLDGNICADTDSLTSISQKENQGQHEYIPYTNKKLNWHTDGYYNLAKNTIYSMLLHCFQEAQQGGESAFMDHEIAYILLRDQNPNWIKALSHDQVLTIPANSLNGKIIRAEQTGPVFSTSPQGRLHMRYSARLRNIVWQQNKETLDAVDYLKYLLNSDMAASSESQYIIRHKLSAGEGIISRNILHCRSAFEDQPSPSSKRLLFRGRFYDELPSK